MNIKSNCIIANQTNIDEISIKETDEYRPAVTWDLKNKFNKRFGVVDAKSSPNYKGLLLDYKKGDIIESGIYIKGNFYNEAGSVFKFETKPSSIYQNTQTVVQYSLSRKPSKTSCFIDVDTGELIIYELSETYDTVTIKSTIYVQQTTG